MPKQLVVYGTFYDSCAEKIALTSVWLSKADVWPNEIGPNDKCWSCDTPIKKEE